MRRFVIVPLLAFVLVACGEDKDSKGKAGTGTGGGEGGTSQKSPEEAYADYRKAVLARDARGVWNSLSAASRKVLGDRTGEQLDQFRKQPPEVKEAQARAMDMSVAEMEKASPEEVMVKQFAMLLKEDKQVAEMEKKKFVRAEVKDSRAIVELKDHEAKDEKIVLVREDGTWKLDIDETEKLKKSAGEK